MSNSKDTGNVVILTDQLTKAELLGKYLSTAGSESTMGTLFLALQNQNISLYTDKYTNEDKYPTRVSIFDDECHLSVRTSKGRGLTTLLNSKFIEVMLSSLIWLEFHVSPNSSNLQGNKTMQTKSKQFIDTFCKTALSSSLLPEIDFNNDNTVQDISTTFFKNVLRTRASAVSTIYQEDFKLWELMDNGDDDTIATLLNRLLLSGQSTSLNILYKLFLELINYSMINLFCRRFNQDTFVAHIYQTGEIVLSTKSTKESLADKFYKFIMDISASGFIMRYITDIDIMINDTTITSDEMRNLFECFGKDKNVKGITLCTSQYGTLLKDTLRNSYKTIFLMNINYIKQNKGFSTLLDVLGNNAKKFTTIYSISGSEVDVTSSVDYDKVGKQLLSYFACDNEERLAEELGYASMRHMTDIELGEAAIKILDEMVQIDSSDFLAYCSCINGTFSNFHSTLINGEIVNPTELVSKLIMGGSSIDKPPKSKINEICNIYSRDKMDYKDEDMIQPLETTKCNLYNYKLATYFRELFNRGVNNKGGFNVTATAFEKESYGPPGIDSNMGAQDYLQCFLSHKAESPAIRKGCNLFINLLNEESIINSTLRYHNDVVIKELTSISSDIKTIHAFMEITYKTQQKSSVMAGLRTELINDNSILRMSFAKAYIGHIKNSDPNLVVDEFIGFACGDATHAIKEIAEKALRKVMFESKGTPTNVLDGFGKLCNFESGEKRTALAFIEEEVVLSRLKVFDTWLNTLGADISDNLNSEMRLDLVDLFKPLNGIRPVYLNSGERLEDEELKANLNAKDSNFSNKALVDYLLNQLHEVCGVSADS